MNDTVLTTTVADVRPGRELRITRLFDAPRALVFTLWTEPQHVERWWGPKGFTSSNHDMDTRPGGLWRFDQRGPDGEDFERRVVFTEVVKPERLAYTHPGDLAGEPGRFHVTAAFADEDGKTRLTMRIVFEPSADETSSPGFKDERRARASESSTIA